MVIIYVRITTPFVPLSIATKKTANYIAQNFTYQEKQKATINTA